MKKVLFSIILVLLSIVNVHALDINSKNAVLYVLNGTLLFIVIIIRLLKKKRKINFSF